MKKVSYAVLVLIACLLIVSVVYAHFPEEKNGDYETVDIESVKKFQQETLTLRDRLMVKKLELRQEYRKEKPDYAKIGEIKKEMIDIRTQIATKAEAAGLPAWIGLDKSRHCIKHEGHRGGRYHCPQKW